MIISEETKTLYEELCRRGYNQEFAQLICQQLNTTWTANRMLGYLRNVTFVPEEELADEMLAILNHRDQIREKKEAEYYQAKMNELKYRDFGGED